MDITVTTLIIFFLTGWEECLWGGLSDINNVYAKLGNPTKNRVKLGKRKKQHNVLLFSCRRRIRTSKGQLGNSPVRSTLFPFPIPIAIGTGSPPPRQEGMSASFNILQECIFLNSCQILFSIDFVQPGVKIGIRLVY